MDKTFVALLRGINVGGNTLIRMADLKQCFEQLGFDRVATFIASGNVVFTTSKGSAAVLTPRIESALSERFRYQAKIVVISEPQLAYAVQHAPKGFGARPDAFRFDVIFLRPPLTPAETLRQIPTKEGVDEASAGRDVVYFSRLTAKVSQSRLPRIVSLPLYKEITVRTWNTTTKLLDLMTRGSPG